MVKDMKNVSIILATYNGEDTGGLYVMNNNPVVVVLFLTIYEQVNEVLGKLIVWAIPSGTVLCLKIFSVKNRKFGFHPILETDILKFISKVNTQTDSVTRLRDVLLKKKRP